LVFACVPERVMDFVTLSSAETIRLLDSERLEQSLVLDVDTASHEFWNL
jgi:hypothetical protein